MNIDMTEEQYKELREDFRLAVDLPFSFNHVDEDKTIEETNDIDQCLSAIESEVPGGKLLAEAFGLLNEKLSIIIETLEKTGRNISFPENVEISLSVGGVGFRNEKALLPGEVLRLVLALPPMPYDLINTLGVVIRSEEKSDKAGTYFDIAVKFQQIDEDERQDITKFLFNEQRRAGH